MIPVNEPWLTDLDLQNVAECVRSGWVSSAGKSLDKFEERWAGYCGRRYGVGVSSGTAALQVALAALDLKPGDEVILPTFTIISCALAVVQNGGVPVLADSEPRTWCVDVDKVEEKITSRTRAILVVHIYGHPVDMEPLLELAGKRGLVVIEDAAEAHGAEVRVGRDGDGAPWRRCGSFGSVSCFSFYANKLITTGEGGMLVTDDPELAERCRSLRNLCFQSKRRFHHERLGFNFRLTNIQAALGLSQLERMEEILERKRRMGREYTRRLKDLPQLRLPVEEPWARPVCWVYALLVSEATGMDAEGFARKLKALGVDTRPFFLGMHEQPVFLDRGLFRGERYPVAERIARQGLYLPSGLTLTDEQLEQVCAAVKEALA